MGIGAVCGECVCVCDVCGEGSGCVYVSRVCAHMCVHICVCMHVKPILVHFLGLHHATTWISIHT